MKISTLDPFVIVKKAVYMQRISDLVGLGYDRYIVGQIPASKAGFFAAKMHLFYASYDTKLVAHRKRKLGFASSRLLYYFPGGDSQLHWILLLTPGEWPSPHRGAEKWLNPTMDRVTLTGYELVRHIRTGNAKPSWTWRYNSRRHDELRDAIIMAIRRHHNQELEQLIDTIWRSPAFAGVREQVKKFAALIKSEWTRTGVGDMPALPKGLGYVRRLPDKGMVLSKFIKEI